MQQQANPFIQHAVQHGQMMLNEASRLSSIPQNMISTCDEIIQSLTTGNTQRAITAAQNLRTMSEQVSQSSQFLNTSISQRMDMISYVLNRAQNNISEINQAVQSMRGIQLSQPGAESWRMPYQPSPHGLA